MTSPLVERILAELKICTDVQTRGVLLSELVCYWARTGEFDEAERLRVELRKEFGDGRSGRVSVMIMCAESLLQYFKDLSPAARDRMARAALLSNAGGDRRLIALTSAWMAHIDFNQNRYATMAESVRRCLSCLDSDDRTAQCRVSLVLGDAYLFAGQSSTSQRWYERARQAAVALGDQAAIGAMMYNRAALKISSARFNSITQPDAAIDVLAIRMELRSAINYQAIARVRSLEHLLGTADIGIRILSNEFEGLSSLIQQLLNTGDVTEHSAQRFMLEADLILVDSIRGESTQTGSALAAFPIQRIDGLAADDRALILSSLVKASLTCGQQAAVERFSGPLESAVEEHQRVMAGMRQNLAEFETVEVKAH